jgi:D-alanine-D-alanine ligase
VGRVNVLVAYNDDVHLKSHLSDVEKIGESEVVETAQEVASLIDGELFPVRDVREAIDALRRRKPDLVFNLCEGVGGRADWEMHFGLALEMLGIRATGTDPLAAGICNDKILTKRILSAAGVSVPKAYDGSDGVWIVKPSREDAGIGIDDASVCRSHADVTERSRWVTETYRQPALVEEFIDGRELNQALFYSRDGIVMLPPGEVEFSRELKAEERVVGWKAKWAAGSREDLATVSRTGVIDDTLRSDVASVSRKAVEVLSLGGYCRLDLRQRPSGELCVIDINPNPDIGRGTGFRKALQAAGIEFRDFLNELMISVPSRRHP